MQAARAIPQRPSIRGICSMATRGLLNEWAAGYAPAALHFEAVGGVEAARRLADGEAFDLAVLDAKAIDRLCALGRLQADGRQAIVRSQVVVAVRAGDARPALASVESLQSMLLHAQAIGYSTGPSGVALLDLFERWGMKSALADRLVQAPPGVPVASLLGQGRVSVGFQQASELMGIEGIDVIGPLPEAARIETVFVAAPVTGSAVTAAVRECIAQLASPASAQAMQRHGLAPA